MTPPLRLTIVMTHPVQYYAPWFRYVAANCPEIDLTVVYATQPTPEQQGTGFGTAFAWDVPLLEGYRSVVVRPARQGDDVHSSSFRGLDVPEIGSAILETRPDVVLVPGWYSITLVRAIRACRRAGVPLIYRGDSILATPYRGWRKIARSLRARYFLRQYAGYLSVGTRSREYLRRHGASPTRIFASPHCVDNNSFAEAAAAYQSAAAQRSLRAELGLPEDGFVALFAGKLEEKKRPIDLIRAAAWLDKTISLLVVGAGPQGDECRCEAESLNVNVAWTGFLNQSQICRAYAAADCLVLPSDTRETWGLVVNEALATGLPCVVSNAAGCAPDLITPGETGEMYPVGDVEALAAALARVRQKTQDGHDWKPACRERADRHSFKQAAVGLVAACEALHYYFRARRSAPGNKPPRVLALFGGFVIYGGMERMCFEVLRVVRDTGGVVHCLVNDWENHRITATAEQIGATWTTGFSRHQVRRRMLNPFKWMKFGFGVLRSSAGTMRDAVRFRPTHVLLPEFRMALINLPTLILLRLSGVRIVMRLGTAPDTTPFYRRMWKYIIDPLVDEFVGNSQFTRDQLLLNGIPDRKVTYVYNVVPTRKESKAVSVDKDSKTIIYVGQIIPEKGVDLALDAVKELVRRGHDVRLDCIGQMDGWEHPKYSGYRQSLRDKATQKEFSGRVAFLGIREDVPQLLSRAAVHCCPSLPEQREAFGIVNVEAKAAGIPSVVFPTGALPELVTHRVDGWVCSDCTAESLADGLEYFLQDSTRAEAAGVAAKRSLVRFSRESFIDVWRSAFSYIVDASEEGVARSWFHRKPSTAKLHSSSAAVVEEDNTPSFQR